MSAHIKKTEFPHFTWIDISEPDPADLMNFASEFDLDYFLIKDSLEPGHLPKLERVDNYNFLILRAYTAAPTDRVTNINELSNKIALFYNEKRVISIHRTPFDFLDNTPKVCSDTEEMVIHIIYRMIHTFVAPSEILSKEIDDIEHDIFIKKHSKISIEDLYFQKSETRVAKKLLQITQNVINQIEVKDKSKTAIQDIKDQLLNLILVFDEVAEDANNLLNTYLSVNAQKNNDVMKLLTIFSAFFLPLTFIAGIYGMNFENMPELKWKYGYFEALGLMILISLFIFIWFRRKRVI
jgi:magnesium transporter